MKIGIFKYFLILNIGKQVVSLSRKESTKKVYLRKSFWLKFPTFLNLDEKEPTLKTYSISFRKDSSKLFLYFIIFFCVLPLSLSNLRTTENFLRSNIEIERRCWLFYILPFYLMNFILRIFYFWYNLSKKKKVSSLIQKHETRRYEINHIIEEEIEKILYFFYELFNFLFLIFFFISLWKSYEIFLKSTYIYFWL